MFGPGKSKINKKSPFNFLGSLQKIIKKNQNIILNKKTIQKTKLNKLN